MSITSEGPLLRNIFLGDLLLAAAIAAAAAASQAAEELLCVVVVVIGVYARTRALGIICSSQR